MPHEEDRIASVRSTSLSPEERTTIQHLDSLNVPIPEIARTLNRSQAAIKSTLSLATETLQAASVNAVEDWITASKVSAARGRHAAARDLLIAAKVIDPPYTPAADKSSGTHVTVQIGVAIPGLPVPATPQPLTITALPSTGIEQD